MKTPLHFNPVHIFRSILREASYHPDPKARIWLKQHTIKSFRKSKEKLINGYSSWPKATRASRETSLLSRARKFESVLRRANEGSIDHFRRTLNLTYGRRGPRRRQLMRSIMATGSSPSSPSSPLSPLSSESDPFESPSSQTTNTHTQGQSHTSLAPAKFLDLARSQASNMDYIPSQKRPIQVRGPKKKLPATTIWNRPMPEVRVQRHLQKWYAKEADTLYPPLQRNEWAYIRNIALGKHSLTVPPQRKKGRGGVLVEEAAWDDLPQHTDSEKHAEAKVRWHINILAPLNRSLPKQERKPAVSGTYRARWLSRQYAWLLRHTPLAVDGRRDADPHSNDGDDADDYGNDNAAATAASAATTSVEAGMDADSTQKLPSIATRESTWTPQQSRLFDEPAVMTAADESPRSRADVKGKGKGNGKGNKGKGKKEDAAAADAAVFLWDDAYTKTVYVKERVTDPEMKRLLFG